MDILVCSIEGQQIGLVLAKINSVVLAVETTPLPNAPDHFLGAITVHGLITPVLNMRKILGEPIRELEVQDQFILCNIHQKQVALWVDKVKYVRHCKEEEFIPAEQILPDLMGLQYALKDNGQIILIYDLEKLLPDSSISLACHKLGT